MQTISQIAKELRPYVTRWIDERLLGGVASVGGGGSSSGAPTPHDLDSIHHGGQLADSQAPQFLKTDGSRQLTGNLSVAAGVTIDGVDISVFYSTASAHITSASNPHSVTLEQARAAGDTVTGQVTFSPTAALAPFVLGANAQGQLVTGLNADQWDGYQFADYLNQGVRTTDSPTLNALNITDKIAHTGDSNTVINFNNDRITFYAGGVLFADLTEAATNYLDLAPGGTIVTRIGPSQQWVFDPAGTLTTATDIDPATAYAVNLGNQSYKYLSAHIAELWASNLVAEDMQATIGGRIIVAPTTKLIAAVAPYDSTIDVKHNTLSSGDRLRLEADGKIEFMAITSAATAITGGYRYSVTRDLEGAGDGGNDWYEGDAVVNTGTTGDGLIDIYAQDGIFSGFGPTIVGLTRTGTAYNAMTETWAIGNLNGLYGYAGNVYGAAFGKYAANQPWLAVDNTYGLRIMRYTTQMARWDTSGNILIGQESASQSNVYVSSGGVKLRTDTNTHIDLQADGDVLIGENTSSPSTTNIAIFTAAQTYNSESMGAGDMLIGDNGASKANLLWDKSEGRLKFRGGTTTKLYVDTTGNLVAGGGIVTISDTGIYIPSASEDPTTTNYAYKVGAASLSSLVTGPWGSPLGRLYVNGGSVGSGLVLSARGDSGSKSATIGAYVNYDYGPTWDQYVEVEPELRVSGDVRYTGSLVSYKNSTEYPVYGWVPLQTQTDHASYDGSSGDTLAVGNYTLDTSSLWGLPAGVKGVWAYIGMRWTSAGATTYKCQIHPGNPSTYTVPSGIIRSYAANQPYEFQGFIPCDSNGDFGLKVFGGTASYVIIRIFAYLI